MSPADLRANYDVLIFTQSTASTLNADWNTRILPYLDLGGSVYFEDDVNLNDLNPSVAGVFEDLELWDTYEISPVPILTDGYTSLLEHHHFNITSYSSDWEVFITGPAGVGTYGIHTTRPSGGRMVVWSPALDYHGDKFAATPDDNLYAASVAVTDWLTQFNSSGSTVVWDGPGGFTSTDVAPVITGATPADAGTYTVTCTDINGCSSSATTNVVINTPPAVVASNNGPVCEGADVTLNVSCDPGDARFIRAAGVGASLGVRSFDGVFLHGDLPGIIDRIGVATFNSMSPADLRANYDVLIFTQSTASTLNADWNTRILPYLDLGGSVYFEDDVNLNDLNPSVAGVFEDLELWDTYEISPVPILTDGYTSLLEHHHFNITSYSSDWEVFITGPAGVGTYGIHTTRPSGGRMVVWSPALDYHGDKFAATPDDNLYAASVAVTDWLTQFNSSGSTVVWDGPGGFTSTDVAPVITGATTADAGTYTVTCTDINGCSSTGTTTVVVNTNPEADAGADDLICPGASTTLNGAATGGTAPYGYEWASAASLDNASLATPVATPSSTETYTLTVTDINGCVDSDDVTITVADTADPVITCPANITVECDQPNDPSATGMATATDNCDGDPAITSSDLVTAGECPQASIIIRTWTATDENGRSSSCDQQIDIVDTTPPAISVAASDQSVECDGGGNSAALASWLVSNGGAAATDNCGTVTWSSVFISSTPACGGTGSDLYRFTATDECGNSSITEASFIIVDTEAPSITCPDDIVLSACESMATWTTTASDVCGSVAVTCSPMSGVTVASGATITSTCTAEDECGNTTDCSFSITRKEALEIALCGDTSYVAVGWAPEASTLISVSATTGGEGPYTYAWSNGESGTEIVVAPSITTTYCVIVTDADGCTAETCHTVIAIDVQCVESISSGSRSCSDSDEGSGSSRSRSSNSSDASCGTDCDQRIIMCNLASGSSSGSKSSSKSSSKSGSGSSSKSSSKSGSKSGSAMDGPVERCVSVCNVGDKLNRGWTLGPCGSPSFENTECGDPSYYDCNCNGGLNSVSVVYDGDTADIMTVISGGDTLGVYAVNPGDVVSVTAAGGLAGNTYIYLQNADCGSSSSHSGSSSSRSGSGSSHSSHSHSGSNDCVIRIPTSCDEVIVGGVFGPIAVLETIDATGAICNVDAGPCGGCGVLMCQPLSNGDKRLRCVDPSKVSKKLDKGWVLGPCHGVIAKEESVSHTTPAVATTLVDGIEFDAFPNPFHSKTKIVFSAVSEEEITLEVYSLTGVKVASLFEGELVPGQVYEKEFNSHNLTSGIYFARMTTAKGEIYTKKLILNR